MGGLGGTVAITVSSGEYALVSAVGAEKMREVPSRGLLVAQAVNRGHPVLAKGRTPRGMFALVATRYFKEYGAREEALGAVATKNHYHGSLNPRASHRRTLQELLGHRDAGTPWSTRTSGTAGPLPSGARQTGRATRSSRSCARVLRE